MNRDPSVDLSHGRARFRRHGHPRRPEQFALEAPSENPVRHRRGRCGGKDDVAQHHADARGIDRLGYRVPPSLPPRVKRQVHHGIERFDQLRWKVDSLGVELEIAHEACAPRVDTVGLCLVFRVGTLDIQAPAAGRWIGGRVHPRLDDTPELVERRGAGEHSSESDDGNRLGHQDYALVGTLSSSRL
jgi:hypothetical protein